MASILLVLDLVSKTLDKSMFNRVYVSLVAFLIMLFSSYKGGVSRAVDLDGGCEEIERSDILNSYGSNTI
jgi:hypothetical protein